MLTEDKIASFGAHANKARDIKSFCSLTKGRAYFGDMPRRQEEIKSEEVSQRKAPPPAPRPRTKPEAPAPTMMQSGSEGQKEEWLTLEQLINDARNTRGQFQTDKATQRLDEIKKRNEANWKALCRQIKGIIDGEIEATPGTPQASVSKLSLYLDASGFNMSEKLGKAEQGAKKRRENTGIKVNLRNTEGQIAAEEARKRAEQELVQKELEERVQREKEEARIKAEKAAREAEERTRQRAEAEQQQRLEEEQRRAEEEVRRLAAAERQKAEEIARMKAGKKIAAVMKAKAELKRLRQEKKLKEDRIAAAEAKSAQRMAALQSIEDQRAAEDKALRKLPYDKATTIQAAFRGYMARQKFKAMKEAAAEEKARRDEEEQHRLEEEQRRKEEEGKAATTIQAAFRGSMARKNFKEMQPAAAAEKARRDEEKQRRLEEEQRRAEEQHRLEEEQRRAEETAEEAKQKKKEEKRISGRKNFFLNWQKCVSPHLKQIFPTLQEINVEEDDRWKRDEHFDSVAPVQIEGAGISDPHLIIPSLNLLKIQSNNQNDPLNYIKNGDLLMIYILRWRYIAWADQISHLDLGERINALLVYCQKTGVNHHVMANIEKASKLYEKAKKNKEVIEKWLKTVEVERVEQTLTHWKEIYEKKTKTNYQASQSTNLYDYRLSLDSSNIFIFAKTVYQLFHVAEISKPSTEIDDLFLNASNAERLVAQVIFDLEKSWASTCTTMPKEHN